MARIASLMKISHPGGENVITVSPNDTVVYAATLMRDHKIGALPVMESNKMIGIITDADMARRVVASLPNLGDATVSNFMTPNPESVTTFTDVQDCLNLMQEIGSRHMPVVENGQLVGIVSIRDVLHLLLKDQELLAQNLEDYIRGR